MQLWLPISVRIEGHWKGIDLRKVLVESASPTPEDLTFVVIGDRTDTLQTRNRIVFALRIDSIRVGFTAGSLLYSIRLAIE